MSVKKSSPESVSNLQALVDKTEADIRQLVAQGKKKHIIWDFDGVLVTPLSDDVFAHVSYDVEKYFAYEERLLLEEPQRNAWTELAETCGALHESQDIVTARSSYLAHRVSLFMLTWSIPVRWQLFIGHQPKSGSYKIILDSLKGDDWFVYMIDDSEKHVADFLEVASMLGMDEQVRGIVSPVVRK